MLSRRRIVFPSQASNKNKPSFLQVNMTSRGFFLRIGLILSCGAFLVMLVQNNSSNFVTQKVDHFVSVPIDAVMSGDPIMLPQDDPRIKMYIWERGYIQPSAEEPYNLKEPDVDPSIGQAEIVRRLLKFQKNGFFIESGALDGETHSNTLYLEKNLGWTGLLVEPDPKNYELLVSKNRKAWTSKSCLATKPIPHQVQFEPNFNIGKIADPNATDANKNIVVQCFPLYSLLNALEVLTVDYFSLDVEGIEYEVLETIPFDKIFFKVISIEFSHVAIGKEGLRKYMEDKGFVVAAELARPFEPNYANDFIFIHNNFKHLIPKDVVTIMPKFDDDLPQVQNTNNGRYVNANSMN